MCDCDMVHVSEYFSHLFTAIQMFVQACIAAITLVNIIVHSLFQHIGKFTLFIDIMSIYFMTIV